jgi:hypothetical protein
LRPGLADLLAQSFLLLWTWLFVWVFPAQLASLWRPAGQRLRHMLALWLFLAAAVMVTLALSRVQGVSVWTSLLTFAAGPAYGLFLMLRLKLFVALALCLGFCVATLWLLARLRGLRALLCAGLLGAAMVPVALLGQQSWTEWRMQGQAERARLSCVTQSPFWQIVAETPFYGFAPLDFPRFHAIAKRDDQIWYWSFRDQYYERHRPRDEADDRDLMRFVRC